MIRLNRFRDPMAEKIFKGNKMEAIKPIDGPDEDGINRPYVVQYVEHPGVKPEDQAIAEVMPDLDRSILEPNGTAVNEPKKKKKLITMRITKPDGTVEVSHLDKLNLTQDPAITKAVTEAKKSGPLTDEKIQEIFKNHVPTPSPEVVPDVVDPQTALHKRWVIALCNLGSGRFDHLDPTALQDVAILGALSPDRTYKTWLTAISQI